MKLNLRNQSWWGAPQKFSLEKKERKISWLELFYDLIYVIAISKITHQFAQHADWTGFSDYCYFFMIIFWGWLNGSLYHDLHASEGLRTRLMILWQILIIAVLIVTIHAYNETYFQNSIVAIMAMQLYITYLWWSVGIYDKEHRKLNLPYTILYLISFAFMLLALFVEKSLFRITLYLSLFFNFLPPFYIHFKTKRSSRNLRLSPSMAERLGLFTIIVFGEVMTGIINGMDVLKTYDGVAWLNFVLSVSIVFALWWLFFTLVSDRPCKKGFLQSTMLEIIYIPALLALGLLAMSFGGIFNAFSRSVVQVFPLKTVFGFSITLFFIGINLMSFLLEYPETLKRVRRVIQRALLAVTVIIFLLASVNLNIALWAYLLCFFICITGLIAYLNYKWYTVFAKQLNNHENV